MNEGLISKRYAKAIYEHACELDEETLLYHRMQMFKAIWERMPDLKNSMKSPVIPTETKMNLLKKATGKHPEQSYIDFIDLLGANHRLESVFMVSLSYQMLYRQKKKISVVHLVSAKRLPKEAFDRIRLFTEHKTHGKVEFSNKIDPSIDGGFIYQLDDWRIDASIKGQLERISTRLAQLNKSIL